MAISKITSDAIDATGFNLDSDTLTIDATNNRVGIGTTSAVDRLHLHSTAAETNGIRLSNSATGSTSSDGFQIYAGSTGEAVIRQRENDAMVMMTNNTERMRILAGGGLTFNGDTAAANALDDYEEGTWTATTNKGSVTTNGGTYTKIGNQVTIRANLANFTDFSNGSFVQITGLPFTSASNSYGVGACMIRYVNTGGLEYVQAYLGASSGTMFFYALNTSTNAGWTPITYSNANQQWDIIFTLSYIV